MRHLPSEPSSSFRAAAGAALHPVALLALASFAVLAAGGATRGQVPACSGIDPLGPSTASLTATARPAIGETERLRDHRFPLLERVDGAAPSFWDFAPAELWLVLGVEKTTVESFDAADWRIRLARWRRFRELLEGPIGDPDRPRLFREIDWLVANARAGRHVRQEEWIEHGLGSAVEVRAAADPSRRPSTSLDAEGLWIAVAALYLDRRLEPSALFHPRETRVLDATWHALPGTSSWNVAAGRARLRRLLCSGPAVRYLARDAENAPDPAAALDAIDRYVQETVADYEQVAPLLAPGTARSRFLSLIPDGPARDAAATLLEEQGAAKAYLAFKGALHAAVESDAGLARPGDLWSALPPHVRFLWPDPCLSGAIYPGSASPIYGRPWTLAARCDAPVADRDALHALLLQETTP